MIKYNSWHISWYWWLADQKQLLKGSAIKLPINRTAEHFCEFYMLKRSQGYPKDKHNQWVPTAVLRHVAAPFTVCIGSVHSDVVNCVAFQGQCFVAINPENFAPGFADRMSDLLSIQRNMEAVSRSYSYNVDIDLVVQSYNLGSRKLNKSF